MTEATTTAPLKFLVADDEENIRRILETRLVMLGHEVTLAENGAQALEHFRASEPDVVVLDVMMPELDGFAVTERIRAQSEVPIILLTALGDVADRITGLQLGADDYMVKPLGTRELIARIRAVLRRSGARTPAGPTDDLLEVGPLRIDRRTHRIHLDGAEIAFTPKEFELLVFLAEDAGAVRTRTDIVEHVWDANWFGPTKTVDAHVASIRRKLGAHSWIESVRGVGFRLVPPEDL